MTLVVLERICRSFGERDILHDVSLRVDDNDRVGVVGDNGAGKTTLIKILAGEDQPDTGNRTTKKDLRIAYGAQLPDLDPSDTVLDYVRRGDGTFGRTAARVTELENQMGERPDDHRLLSEYGHLQAVFEAGGGYQRDHLCEKVLSGLGVPQTHFDRALGVLSGGERSRVLLAALMTSPADLLILDEPTNHLDLRGIAFVEEFVERYPGAVVAVSHDRRFLDRCAKSIIEVAACDAERFTGNYRDYVKQRDERIKQELKAFKNQQEFLQKEMDYIRKHMGSRMTSQAKGRLKRLQRVQVMTRPKTSRKSMAMKMGGGRAMAGLAVLEADQLDVARADGAPLLHHMRFRIGQGESVGIVGANGAGKSTLLRVLAGQTEPTRGTLERSHGIRLAFFEQERQELPTSGSVLDAMREVDGKAEDNDLRSHLALFLFSRMDVEKPVVTLSGGERQRLALARLTRSNFDCICLDEPTNHLDIRTAEGLAEALQGWGGTVIVVSHDRQFLEDVVDKVLLVEDGGLMVFERGLEDCLEFLAQPRVPPTAPREKAVKADAEAPKAAAAPTSTARSGKPDKIRNPMAFARLEEQIMELEGELERLQDEMGKPEVYTDHRKLQELQGEEQAAQGKLEAAYQKWENWQ